MSCNRSSWRFCYENRDSNVGYYRFVNNCTTNTVSIHQLIEQGCSHERLIHTIRSNPKCIESKYSGRYPLHTAICTIQNDPDDLYDITSILLQYDPLAASRTDIHNQVALHYAVNCTTNQFGIQQQEQEQQQHHSWLSSQQRQTTRTAVSVPLLHLLINANPTAVTNCYDSLNQQTPFDLAISVGNATAVQVMVQLFPNLCRRPGPDGLLPLHMAIQYTGSVNTFPKSGLNRRYDNEYYTDNDDNNVATDDYVDHLLRNSVLVDDQIQIVDKILQHYPQAAMMPVINQQELKRNHTPHSTDTNHVRSSTLSMYPIHLACTSRAPVEIFDLLLQAMNTKINYNRKFQHIPKIPTMNRNEVMVSSFNLAIESSCSQEVIELLLETYPPDILTTWYVTPSVLQLNDQTTMATQTQCPLLPIHRAICTAIESDVIHSFHGHNQHHHNNKHHNNHNETSMEYSCNIVNLLAKANPESLLIMLDDEKNFDTGHALHYAIRVLSHNIIRRGNTYYSSSTKRMEIKNLFRFLCIWNNNDLLKHSDNKTNTHWLPLHVAAHLWGIGTIARHPESRLVAQIFYEMIQHYPAAVMIPDGQGRLPIHLLLLLSSSSGCTNTNNITHNENNKNIFFVNLLMLNMLINSHPESLLVGDNFGRLPIHIACNGNLAFESVVNKKPCPSHHYRSEVIRQPPRPRPQRPYPRESLQVSYSFNRLITIQTLVNANPSTVLATTLNGDLPLILAACHNDDDDLNGTHPNRNTECCSSLSMDIIFFLVQRSPELFCKYK